MAIEGVVSERLGGGRTRYEPPGPDALIRRLTIYFAHRYSRSHRICRPSLGRNGGPWVLDLGAVCDAGLFDLGGTGFHGSIHLHDLGSHHPSHRRRASRSHQTALADQALRDGRCHLAAHPVRRYLPHICPCASISANVLDQAPESCPSALI